jgi:hypothetical protein
MPQPKQRARTPHSRSTSRDSSAHYGCASIVCVLPTTEILQTDVLRSVVVGVVLIPTLLTLEALAVAITVVGKPTRRATLRRVSRVYLYGFDAVFFGLVFDVLVNAELSGSQMMRRPPVMARTPRPIQTAQNWTRSTTRISASIVR